MGNDLHDWGKFLFWWLASLFAATTVVVAKLGLKLYGEAADVPADPALAVHWARRRRYLALAELSAIPAFATGSVVLVSYYHIDPVVAVLIAMAQGFVGFPLLLDGATFLFKRRLGLPQTSSSAQDRTNG